MKTAFDIICYVCFAIVLMLTLGWLVGVKITVLSPGVWVYLKDAGGAYSISEVRNTSGEDVHNLHVSAIHNGRYSCSCEGGHK